MRTSPESPDGSCVSEKPITPPPGELDELVAFLRSERCIAFVRDDGELEVIPPPHVDPDDQQAVADLVRAWEERAA